MTVYRNIRHNEDPFKKLFFALTPSSMSKYLPPHVKHDRTISIHRIINTFLKSKLIVSRCYKCCIVPNFPVHGHIQTTQFTLAYTNIHTYMYPFNTLPNIDHFNCEMFIVTREVLNIIHTAFSLLFYATTGPPHSPLIYKIVLLV